jgi:hypothetical protein
MTKRFKVDEDPRDPYMPFIVIDTERKLTYLGDSRIVARTGHRPRAAELAEGLNNGTNHVVTRFRRDGSSYNYTL